MEKGIETVTNSKLDLRITKDDILIVLINEKLEGKDNELIVLKDKLSSVEAEIKKRINKLNKSICGFEDVECLESSRYTDSITIKMFNIEEIEGLKSPKHSKKKFINKSFHSKFSIKGTVNVTKHFTIDGFEGELSKKIIPKKTKVVNEQLTNINKLYEESISLNVEINKVEYEMLLIQTDNSIKSNLIKKIAKSSSDLNLLLK